MRVLACSAGKPAALPAPTQEDTDGYELARGPSCALSVAAPACLCGHDGRLLMVCGHSDTNQK
jgi:hypothetical protein